MCVIVCLYVQNSTYVCMDGLMQYFICFRSVWFSSLWSGPVPFCFVLFSLASCRRSADLKGGLQISLENFLTSADVCGYFLPRSATSSEVCKTWRSAKFCCVRHQEFLQNLLRGMKTCLEVCKLLECKPPWRCVNHPLRSANCSSTKPTQRRGRQKLPRSLENFSRGLKTSAES